MKQKNLFLIPALAAFILMTWQAGIGQTIVGNPTATQTITQPSGTNFNVDGVQTLLWPGLFRIANESGAIVFRDMTQANAWFFVPQNLGGGSGQIAFFGNFSNGGTLIPLNAFQGSVGSATHPWAAVYADAIFKNSGAFRIDHPLDPRNKYLQHSFVESPDMKNVYDGLVILDNQGEAWVTLPNWFQALNSDFRYQLTSIGVPGPGLYVAEEMANNKFKIAGGKPGSKVSWQLTGIRQDAYAKAHRIAVEVEKPPEARGKYQHPELYEKQPKDALVSAPADGTTGKATQDAAGHLTGNK